MFSWCSARAEFSVTIRHRSAGLKCLSKYFSFHDWAHLSSRSMFIEPDGTQSVPSAIMTPARSSITAWAVLP